MKLADAQSGHPIPLYVTRWKSDKELGMEGDDAESWNSFVHLLEINFINLGEEKHDRLIWTMNSTNGDYTTKEGYEMEIIDQIEGDKYWWWTFLCASKRCFKNTLTFWLAINNKLLTWENMRTRGFQGSGLFFLCKSR